MTKIRTPREEFKGKFVKDLEWDLNYHREKVLEAEFKLSLIK